MRRLLGKLAVVAAVALLVALPSFAAETTETFTKGPLTLTIQDDAGTTSALTVPAVDPDELIADVDVAVRIDTPVDGNLADLDLTLRHGTTAVELSSDNGGNDSDYGSGTGCDGTLTTFDDEAATGIASGTPPYDASFKPEGDLSAFDGSIAEGTWTLEIADDLADGGEATLLCWEVTITFAEADLGVTLTDTPDPVAPGGSVTYKATIENKGPSLSKDTEFDLALPAGATVVSATVAPSDKGTCAGTGPVICDLDVLAKDAKVDVTVVATLTGSGSLAATATVDGAATDPVTTNNTATTSTLVQEGASSGSETITVTRDGTGKGTVVSNPAGISCGTDCEGGFGPSTEVSLTATPAADSFFVGWGGACAAFLDAIECRITASGAVNVTATFESTVVPGAGSGGGSTSGSSGGTKASFYICTITGNEKANVLRGTKKRDVICGLGGNDKIYGLGGNDVLIGGAGKDVLVGGAGADTFFSKDRSADTIKGGAGRDKVKADFRDALLGIEESVG